MKKAAANSLYSKEDRLFISSLFLGSKGENTELVKSLLSNSINEHLAWRTNFHPEDDQIKEALDLNLHSPTAEKIRTELEELTKKLQHSAPVYNPRYLGQSASDLMVPSLLAQLITTFYNPNNSLNDLGETAIRMELKVGLEFAKLFGFNTDPNQTPCAWGHVTSGGSDANYESLWNFRTVKYHPVAVVEALKEMRLNISLNDRVLKDPFEYSAWELVNLSIDEVLSFRSKVFEKIKSKLGVDSVREFYRLLQKSRIETIGPSQFFAEHYRLHQPVVLVPSTAFDFWTKAMRLMGFGSASLIEVPIDQHMRMDIGELDRILGKLLSQNIPVLSVVGVLGTTEFGSIDPIHKIVELRDKYAKKGLCFYIHVDASQGGYLKTLFVDNNGRRVSRNEVISENSDFPSTLVYQAFDQLGEADSITIAPHTLGYLPQGIGGFVTRNREIVKLLNPREKNIVDNKDQLDLLQLSHYILEGTKPGANAASLYVTHRILPLNSEGFGRVIRGSIIAAQYFAYKVQELEHRLKDLVSVTLPFEPDSFLVCIALNPKANNQLKATNEFVDSIFKRLAHDTQQSVQIKDYLCSISEMDMRKLSEAEANRQMESLGIKEPDIIGSQQSSLKVLKHSLMNPWLLTGDTPTEHIDEYFQFLEKIIKENC
ncbi:pyridoxal-dependent decarboxylase [Aliikangiella sp. G2MR2-5]|uniref:pyridoxal phosphate-dependent decarboxylase family protein n=1 Tax=Aliikangiella sp. G2MR2-5 TaxID=2788943 RepID=UPI0018AAE9A5|nr:pyridoxal-dependent decarboxylase [Aliikangiella sp. G2MR2-5]